MGQAQAQGQDLVLRMMDRCQDSCSVLRRSRSYFVFVFPPFLYKIPFSCADSMTSEQRQKLAKERREERARYIGRESPLIPTGFDFPVWLTNRLDGCWMDVGCMSSVLTALCRCDVTDSF